MSFQIQALSEKPFQHLFDLSTEELTARLASRVIANKKPGFPCRVSLADAEIGEETILVHYEHQDAETPFRASHAVYVRHNAQQAKLAADEVPEMFRSRMLSLRGFDNKGMMLDAELAEGRLLESAIKSMFRNPDLSYLHLHFAQPGCYAARVDRIES